MSRGLRPYPSRRARTGIILAALAAVPATAADAQPRVVRTTAPVDAVAMDGDLVAVHVARAGRRCDHPLLWNLRTRATPAVTGLGTCIDLGSTGGVGGLAVAGPRVAWIVRSGGNTESVDRLYTASEGAPRGRFVQRGRRFGDVGGAMAGVWLSGLVGDGSFLGYNAYRTAIGATQDVRVTEGYLREIRGRQGVTVARGATAIVAQSADEGRVATLDGRGGVTLLTRDGRLLRSFHPPLAEGVALRANRLAVVSSAGALELYDTDTGARVRRWPIARGVTHVDMHRGYAVYSVYRTVYALQLTSGRQVVVARLPRAVVGTAIEARGVVYAANMPTGRVLFESFPDVVSLFRR